MSSDQLEHHQSPPALIAPNVAGYCVATAPLEGVGVVHLIGEFDISRAENTMTVIGEALDRCAELHLDLGEVAFLDSSTLHVLIDASIAGSNEGKRVSVVATSSFAYRLIELSGLVDFFRIDAVGSATAS